MSVKKVQVYTDGSCHTQLKIGGWAAIILFGEGDDVILSGTETDTSHNSMELLAVIKAIQYLNDRKLDPDEIEVLSDSNYVVNLNIRKRKLQENGFKTNAGKPVRNQRLVGMLIELFDSLPVTLTKVRAHQKQTLDVNYNRKADIIARKLVRDYVRRL